MDDIKTSPASFFLTPLHYSDSCTQSQTFPSGPVSAECRSLQNYTTRLSAGYKAFFFFPSLVFRHRKRTLERSCYIIVQAPTHCMCTEAPRYAHVLVSRFYFLTSFFPFIPAFVFVPALLHKGSRLPDSFTSAHCQVKLAVKRL